MRQRRSTRWCLSPLCCSSAAWRPPAGIARRGGWGPGCAPPEHGGLARAGGQTAQPLGIALGALVIPELAERSKSATAALIFPAILCAVSAVLSVVAITEPPRKEWDEATQEELANPYRGSWGLRP